MIEPVLEHIVAAADQSRDRSQIGHVTGRKQQRPLPAGERGQFLFQGMVRRTVAANQMRGAAAAAVTVGAAPERRDHVRMIG